MTVPFPSFKECFNSYQTLLPVRVGVAAELETNLSYALLTILMISLPILSNVRIPALYNLIGGFNFKRILAGAAATL